MPTFATDCPVTNPIVDVRLTQTQKRRGFTPRDLINEMEAILYPVEREVDSLRQLEEGWDGDEAPPVDMGTATIAKKLIRYTLISAASKGLRWLKPRISPSVDGGVHILFRDKNEY